MKLPALLLGSALLIAAQPATEPAPAPASEEEGSRVVRGTPVLPGSVPWQIQIFTKVKLTPKELKDDRDRAASDPKKRFYEKMEEWERDHMCGGALIEDGWALSAAHCFVDGQDRLVKLSMRGARIGAEDLGVATPMRIDRIIVHGGYRRTGSKQHDIALLRLVPARDTNAEVAARAKPVPVLSPQQLNRLTPGNALKVTGWGHTSERESGATRSVDGKAMRSSKMLLEGRLTLRSQAECANVQAYRKTLNPGVLCVGSADSKEQDSCQGDSGGPLTRQRVLVGLVSTGEGCGVSGVPALYTNVAYYADWIAAAKAQSKPGQVAHCVVNAGALDCAKPISPRRTGRG